MEIVLEIERPGGGKSWHVLGAEPVTVGRGLRNTIILDDPYADDRHVRVARGPDDAWYIEDVGSANGTWLDARKLAEPVAVRPGQVLTVGRTTMRIRDRDEPVGAALVERPQPATVAAAPVAPVEPVLAPRLGARRGGPFAAAAIVAFALLSWSTSSEQTVGSSLFMTASGAWLFLAVWAGIWAILGRIIAQKFYYQGHLVIASVATLVAFALATLGDWVTFLFPGSSIWGVVTTIGGIAFVSATVTAHLGLATHIRRERLVRTAASMALTGIALVGVSALLDEEQFSDVPSVVSSLKPLRPGLVPAMSVTDFGEAIAGLREETDELATKGERPPTGMALE